MRYRHIAFALIGLSTAAFAAWGMQQNSTSNGERTRHGSWEDGSIGYELGRQVHNYFADDAHDIPAVDDAEALAKNWLYKKGYEHGKAIIDAIVEPEPTPQSGANAPLTPAEIDDAANQILPQHEPFAPSTTAVDSTDEGNDLADPESEYAEWSAPAVEVSEAEVDHQISAVQAPDYLRERLIVPPKPPVSRPQPTVQPKVFPSIPVHPEWQSDEENSNVEYSGEKAMDKASASREAESNAGHDSSFGNSSSSNEGDSNAEVDDLDAEFESDTDDCSQPPLDNRPR